MRNPKSDKKVLITGGAGFIGAHLANTLLKRGYRVRVMDNLQKPNHGSKPPAWLNRDVHFVRGDVRKKTDWEKALKGVSHVFHLAGYMDYRMDFSTYVRANSESTALLYEIIVEKKLPIKKVILASSQAVYGEGKYECADHCVQYAKPRDPKRLTKGDWDTYCVCGAKFVRPLPQREDDQIFPINPYGISKRGLEQLSLMLGKEYGIPTVVLRYAIVHGPQQSFKNFYSGALRSYVVQALAGERIEMHEDGQQIRDFVHIDDVVAAHIAVLESRKADFEIFNVASGRTNTVMDLAETVAKVVGVPHNPLLKGFFRVRTARHSPIDVSKLKSIGWKPQKTLEDNVRDYVAWVRNYPEAIRYLHVTYQELRKQKLVQ